jgi:hypothetical protein
MSWEKEATRLMKMAFAARDFTYKELARRLNDQGIAETHATIASKLSRGRFSFIWFLQCMTVMGQREIHFRIEEPLESERESHSSPPTDKPPSPRPSK